MPAALLQKKGVQEKVPRQVGRLEILQAASDLTTDDDADFFGTAEGHTLPLAKVVMSKNKQGEVICNSLSHLWYSNIHITPVVSSNTAHSGVTQAHIQEPPVVSPPEKTTLKPEQGCISLLRILHILSHTLIGILHTHHTSGQ
jgi:hypothetical protein